MKRPVLDIRKDAAFVLSIKEILKPENVYIQIPKIGWNLFLQKMYDRGYIMVEFNEKEIPIQVYQKKEFQGKEVINPQILLH
jgi:hypothetical protein